MFTYRGKHVSAEDIAFINTLIAQNPADSRRALSKNVRVSRLTCCSTQTPKNMRDLPRLFRCEHAYLYLDIINTPIR